MSRRADRRAARQQAQSRARYAAWQKTARVKR